MNTIIKNKILTILFLLFIIIVSCKREKTHPGYTYFPDMTYSRAYETYSENPNFVDNKTLREPVEGTIPRGYQPFLYEKTENDLIRAGLELSNPLTHSEENIERGRIIYEKFCFQCHGEKGDGLGNLYTSNRYPYPPASLINEKMLTKPDGEMFHQITLGWGIMGAHGLLIEPDDRWKVIIYIRNNLQKQDLAQN